MQNLIVNTKASTGQLKLNLRTLFALSVLLTYLPVNGQSEFEGFAINPKAGMCFGTDFQGFGAGLGLDLIRDRKVLTFDLYSGVEFTIFGGDPAKFRQLGILIGGYRGSRQARIQYQGGVAPTWGYLDGYYTATEYVDSKPYFTLGLTGKIGLKLFISHSVSFGVDLQGNLNLKNPIFFPSVSFDIGKLKEKETALPGGGIN